MSLKKRMIDIRHTLAQGGTLAGKKVVVTAGGTQEPIDPVRFISNRSSGKQGYALAQSALDLGARVTLISTPNTLPEGRPAANQRRGYPADGRRGG